MSTPGRGAGDVVDQLGPRPSRAGLDVDVARLDARVLRPTRQHVEMAVAVAGDVGQHVTDRPLGQA